MHTTLAILLAVAVSGQFPADVSPETIPSPPGYGATGGPGPNISLPTGPAETIGQPAQFAYPTGHMYPDVAPEGIYGPRRCNGWMYPNGICGHRCVTEPHSWGNWWIPPGNMLMHYHYFSAEHGYHSFRPYNVTRVSMQQAFAASYGGDVRHPYDYRRLEENVYKIYNRRHGIESDSKEDPLPPAEPAPDDFNLDP